MRLLLTTAGVATFVGVLLLMPTAASGGGQSSSTLAVKKTFAIQWSNADCPPGSAVTTSCYTAVGRQIVRGLGQTELDLFDAIDSSDPTGQCENWSLTGSLTAGSKGSFALRGSSEGCIVSHSAVGKNSFSITGGSGSFANATGSGVLDFVSFSEALFRGRLLVTGTISAPGYSFDTTPPTLVGLVNETVRVPRKVRRIRVKYSPTAQDTVDGAVPVSCTPRSGSFFKLGRTRVSCSATDSSGNTARGRFSVKVTRAR